MNILKAASIGGAGITLYYGMTKGVRHVSTTENGGRGFRIYEVSEFQYDVYEYDYGWTDHLFNSRHACFEDALRVIRHG